MGLKVNITFVGTAEILLLLSFFFNAPTVPHSDKTLLFENDKKLKRKKKVYALGVV